MSWVFVFFFFKQKTAYEMRISDWSSDVCSSDLASKLAADNDDLLGSLTLMVCVLHPQQNDIEAGSLISEHGMKLARRRAEKAGIIDRKSVVQGKSVSVRVNIGDRRITKKTRCRCE